MCKQMCVWNAISAWKPTFILPKASINKYNISTLIAVLNVIQIHVHKYIHLLVNTNDLLLNLPTINWKCRNAQYNKAEIAFNRIY
jgi:hypothetical protein